jgi:small subunit ribosomal protein S1
MAVDLPAEHGLLRGRAGSPGKKSAAAVVNLRWSKPQLPVAGVSLPDTIRVSVEKSVRITSLAMSEEQQPAPATEQAPATAVPAEGKFPPPKPGAPGPSKYTGPAAMQPGAASVGTMQNRGGPGLRNDRPRNDGSAPSPMKFNDQVAAKPNKRMLDADIEAELAAALGGADLSTELGSAETQQKPVGLAGSINLPNGRKRGTVLSLRGKDVFIDVPGGRSQGVLPIMQFEGKTPQVGDVVEFSIERYDGSNGLLILTMTGAAQAVSDWSSVALNMIVEVKCTGANKNGTGLIVEISGIKGFMPISQIDLYRVEDLNQFVGQTMKAEVVELNREERNLIVSRKSLLEREREAQREKFWAELEVGQTRQGIVRGLQPFGAFVDLGGADGLIPVSEMSWKRVAHPSEVLQVGQRVEVVVKKMDPEARRISLSLRQLLANPWDSFAANNRPGTRIKGTVTRLTEFGAFVELASGIEGLVHISELSTERSRRVRDVVTEGQDVEVQIINIDTEARRVALSMKTIQAGMQATADAAEAVEQEEDVAAAAERMANRAVNPNLRGGIGGARFVYPGS